MVESGGVFFAEKRDEDKWTKYRHVIAQSILQPHIFVKFMHLAFRGRFCTNVWL